MNIPTPADPVMEMARKINADIARQDGAFRHAADIETGRFDGTISMAVALAAIRATTEAAASWVEQYPSPLNDLPMALAIRDLAQGIRANHHIKGSDDV